MKDCMVVFGLQHSPSMGYYYCLYLANAVNVSDGSSLASQRQNQELNLCLGIPKFLLFNLL